MNQFVTRGPPPRDAVLLMDIVLKECFDYIKYNFFEYNIEINNQNIS